MLDRRDRTLYRGVLGNSQLVPEMRLAHADTGVDARARGRLERVGGDIDVSRYRSRESTDHARVTDLGSDAAHALEIAGARDGETRLDHVDTQP